MLISSVLLTTVKSSRMVFEDMLTEAQHILIENLGGIMFGIICLSIFAIFLYLLENTEGITVTKKSSKDIKEPKWVLFRGTGYALILMFVLSVSYFLTRRDTSEYNWQISYACRFVSCVSLVYILVFFGVSFVSEEAAQIPENIWSRRKTLLRSPCSYELPRVSRDVYGQNNSKTSVPEVSPRAPECGVSNVQSDEPKAAALSDEAIMSMSDLDIVDQIVIKKRFPQHQLEKRLRDHKRAVRIRRKVLEATGGFTLDGLPIDGYDYESIFGVNCENVIGYLPIPVGLAGPIKLNGELVYIPMATTEGCLVASTNRGCKALSSTSSGVSAIVLTDGITRAPCVRFPRAADAAVAKEWIESRTNYSLLEASFNSTTSYGRLESITVQQAGRSLYIRIRCFTGDAMGMNMVSKGTMKLLEVLERAFPNMEVASISGNVCSDKKPAAINWINGRGKSIVVDGVIPGDVVKSTLKTTVEAMVELNVHKNLVGSAMAGSIGGFNAHAANLVTAVFLATGQDPAQNVESSNCITMMEAVNNGEDLYVSVTMPSVEVGTVGGGTRLFAQGTCLGICGAKGASTEKAGSNAKRLASVVGAAVLAGEVSLMAALAAGHLVKSHMEHNRK